jgi:molybdopterin molybdotransferase
MSDSIPVAPGCADDSDPMSLSVDAARDRILAAVQPLRQTETVPIATALQRVLAEDIVSGMDVPPHANSAMDGYALSGQDIPASGTRELVVIGTAYAGRPHAGRIEAGQCVRIMTGAPLPERADTVVMQEHVQRVAAHIVIDARHRVGDNVRSAGEDIRAGEVVLNAGRRLIPADIGLIASLGIAGVRVFRRLRVAFFTTGDELKPVGEALAPGEIHDSNRYTLRAMLERLGAECRDVGIVGDTPEATRAAFETAAQGSDAIISSGGVSVGDADFVKEVLNDLGQVEFWKVAIKPGRPLTFGNVQQAVFFGLPGNPVSVMVTFYQFVQPALKRMMGETSAPRLRLNARCVDRLKKRPGRVEFQRGILSQTADGQLIVRKTGLQGSGILTSMSSANCFIVLPEDSTGAEIGDAVTVEPFDGLV